jgi:hypothetical protein
MSARLSLVPAPAWKRQPSIYDLQRLPIARSGEFDLSDREAAQTRRLIYSINKQGKFRYRTLREGSLLQVWRIK